MNPPAQHHYTIVVYDEDVELPQINMEVTAPDPWCALERAAEQIQAQESV